MSYVDLLLDEALDILFPERQSFLSKVVRKLKSIIGMGNIASGSTVEAPFSCSDVKINDLYVSVSRGTAICVSGEPDYDWIAYLMRCVDTMKRAVAIYFHGKKLELSDQETRLGVLKQLLVRAKQFVGGENREKSSGNIYIEFDGVQRDSLPHVCPAKYVFILVVKSDDSFYGFYLGKKPWLL